MQPNDKSSNLSVNAWYSILSKCPIMAKAVLKNEFNAAIATSELLSAIHFRLKREQWLKSLS